MGDPKLASLISSRLFRQAHQQEPTLLDLNGAPPLPCELPPARPCEKCASPIYWLDGKHSLRCGGCEPWPSESDAVRVLLVVAMEGSTPERPIMAWADHRHELILANLRRKRERRQAEREGEQEAMWGRF